MGDIQHVMNCLDCSACPHEREVTIFTPHHICEHPNKDLSHPNYNNQYRGIILIEYPKQPKWCPMKKSYNKDAVETISQYDNENIMENNGFAADAGWAQDKFIEDKVKEVTDRPVGELIEEYAELRDHLAVERKKFKELETNLKSDMELLEVKILEVQRQMGLTSISTGNFTAYQTEKTFVRMGDWDKFSNWVLETKNIQCMEKRPAKMACLEIEEETGTHLNDIGLEKTSEISIQIRKK